MSEIALILPLFLFQSRSVLPLIFFDDEVFRIYSLFTVQSFGVRCISLALPWPFAFIERHGHFKLVIGPFGPPDGNLYHRKNLLHYICVLWCSYGARNLESNLGARNISRIRIPWLTRSKLQPHRTAEQVFQYQQSIPPRFT